MQSLKAVISEIFALFVDDGSLAAAILIWLVAVGAVLTHVDISAIAKGPILFAGLAAILLESGVRRARPRNPPAQRKK